MATVIERLKLFAEELKASLDSLVRTYSEVYRSNPPGSSVVILSGDYSWRPVKPEGRPLQANCLEAYRHFSAILHTLLREQPTATLRSLAEADRTVLGVIQQDQRLVRPDKLAPLQDALQAMDAQVELLQGLYSATEEPVYVPDTNALLYNCALETWRFPAPSFTLVLVPTVLAELDRLKVEHRNRALKERAERLVRQIKEYRRRGSLIQGVPLVTGVSAIRAAAIEPDLDGSLPWLDRHNPDDRIVASVLEVMRTYPRSPVTLVTRDLNLQNKAEFARIPFTEPPEPQHPSRLTKRPSGPGARVARAPAAER